MQHGGPFNLELKLPEGLPRSRDSSGQQPQQDPCDSGTLVPLQEVLLETGSSSSGREAVDEDDSASEKDPEAPVTVAAESPILVIAIIQQSLLGSGHWLFGLPLVLQAL